MALLQAGRRPSPLPHRPAPRGGTRPLRVRHGRQHLQYQGEARDVQLMKPPSDNSFIVYDYTSGGHLSIKLSLLKAIKSDDFFSLVLSFIRVLKQRSSSF